MVNSFRPLSEAVGIVGVGGGEDGTAAGVCLEVIEDRFVAIPQNVAG
jgi:hypothetical protein